MWIDSKVFKEDLDSLCQNEQIEWEKFSNKTVLITGATGLIGYATVCAILYACKMKNINVHIIALVRNMKKANKMFAQINAEFDNLEFYCSNIVSEIKINKEIHYIIHGASITASKEFSENPVETINTLVVGTNNILNIAKNHSVNSMVYLSSMEVYGSPNEKKVLTETDVDYIDPLRVRSCYPEGKRMAENLCVAYSSEYNVNVKIARLAQTFGPGIYVDDNRVFAQFIRNAVNGKDIILKTDGKSERMYVYTADAVAALLVILLKGEKQAAYNIANKETYCSIYDMAQLVAKYFGENVTVLIDDNFEKTKNLYPPNHYLYLDTSKIENLDWKPTVSLYEMYNRMLQEMRRI